MDIILQREHLISILYSNSTLHNEYFHNDKVAKWAIHALVTKRVSMVEDPGMRMGH